MIKLTSNVLILNDDDLLDQYKPLIKNINKLAYSHFKRDIRRIIVLYDIVLFRGSFDETIKIRY